MFLPVDITTFLQAFYLSASLTILIVYWIPAFSTRFLSYGARDVADVKSSRSAKDSLVGKSLKDTSLENTLDKVATLKVAHSWFTHFYMISTCSSLVWFYQLIHKGDLFDILSRLTSRSHSMTMTQIAICWLLLALQGLRRLYESLTLTRGSKSTMWVGHYFIGITFYLATGIAIWIEGTPALRRRTNPRGITAEIEMPCLYQVFLLAGFIFASGIQNSVHRHLASLKKYTLPTHRAFDYIASPHYSAECAIYLFLALLSAPEGNYLNFTMVTSLIFVVANLGVSADGTRKWMEGKFGKECVQGKWRMLPGLW